ncbi:putative quinone oxidoreductase [Nakaseomyces bracarensis]|uniref:Quinone oxidoreductase n=1 Tax=Nakaseomyces bracarensis TaxID=273131 RepID=A0ABR4NMB1_9SACH
MLRSGLANGAKLSLRNFSKMSIPTTQKVILIDGKSDSYDVIKYQDVPVPKIDENDILVKNKYAGVNFIETYFRKGYYPCEVPYILGREAAGEVVQVGSKVKNYNVGDKVAYMAGSTFAQYTKKPADNHIMNLGPDGKDEELKLYGSTFIQCLTALSFVDEAYKVVKGDYILVYAPSGGVGSILCQLISKRGAHVIAVSSSDEKLQLAKGYGAEFLVNYNKDDILERIMEITDGKGVHAAFDSIGKDTFEIDLSALRRKGTLVSYGNASGVVPPLSINRLTPKNLKIVRPSLFGYLTDPEEWQHYTSVYKQLIDNNQLKVNITQTFPLSEYAEVAKLMENKQTTGKICLEIPQ